MRIYFTIALTIFFTHLLKAQTEDELSSEVASVFNYILEKDYPEIFNGEPYQIRPVRWTISDIDDDGITEMFLQTFPHYRQSPTITIYQMDENDSISRITEALAPGHLEPIDPEYDYFDTHTTGAAFDLLTASSDRDKLSALAMSSLENGMNTILFKNFVHTDTRRGSPFFLDISYLNDYPNEESCENFQFSFPDNIVVGRVNDGKFKCFIARVKNELYCYEIRGFTPEGLIEKSITVHELPKDFEQLQVVDGNITYLSKKGKTKNLKI